MDLYAENILDHYRHPRRKGPLAGATITHREVNASCGDSLSLSLRLDGDRIADVAWEGDGCAISQAGMSILSEVLIGKTVAEAATLTANDITTFLGVPVGPRRIKCALLSLHALMNALHAARGEPVQPWTKTLTN